MKNIVIILVLFTSSIIFAQESGNSLNGIHTVFEKQGFIGIQSVSNTTVGNEIKFSLKMNGDIPQKLSNDTIFIEWDILIDADENKATYSWGPWEEVSNDLGVDYLVRVMMMNQFGIAGQIINQKKGIMEPIQYSVDQNMIYLTIDKNKIGNPAEFFYTALVRGYVGKGEPQSLVYWAKSPENSHYICKE